MLLDLFGNLAWPDLPLEKSNGREVAPNIWISGQGREEIMESKGGLKRV